MIQIPSDSLTFTACDEIAAICAAFFKRTQLSYYNYVRVYDDGSRICLSNNQAWMEFVFSHLDRYQITFEEIPEHGSCRYVIWDNFKTIYEDALMTVAREDYDIAHGFTIIETYSDYVEFQYFGAPKGIEGINNFYINHLHTLHHFAFFFKEKAAKLITMAEKDKIKVKKEGAFWMQRNPETGQLERAKSPVTTEQDSVTRYYLGGHYKHVYLTKREAQCLTALLDGLTAKETAQAFHISPSTVQNHLTAIKHKLICHTKTELAQVARHANFKTIANVIRLNDLQPFYHRRNSSPRPSGLVA